MGLFSLFTLRPARLDPRHTAQSVTRDTGRPHIRRNRLQRGWYPALKRAGVYDWKAKTGKHVRFHDLRRMADSLIRDLGVSEGDISATTGHAIAVMRAVYSHPMTKERRGGTDAIAAALQSGHDRAKLPAR